MRIESYKNTACRLILQAAFFCVCLAAHVSKYDELTASLR